MQLAPESRLALGEQARVKRREHPNAYVGCTVDRLAARHRQELSVARRCWPAARASTRTSRQRCTGVRGHGVGAKHVIEVGVAQEHEVGAVDGGGRQADVTRSRYPVDVGVEPQGQASHPDSEGRAAEPLERQRSRRHVGDGSERGSGTVRPFLLPHEDGDDSRCSPRRLAFDSRGRLGRTPDTPCSSGPRSSARSGWPTRRSSTTGGTCRCTSPTAGSRPRLIPRRDGGFEVAFDFIDHQLSHHDDRRRQAHDGARTSLRGEFLRRVHGAARRARSAHRRSGRCRSRSPTQSPSTPTSSTPSYDAPKVHDFWRALVQMDRVFTDFRSRFIGKNSPVHLFWGAFDLVRHPILRPRRTAAPRRRAQLRAVRDARGVLPRSQQRGLLARWRRRRRLLLLRLSGTRRATATSPSRPTRPATTTRLQEFVLPYEIVRTSGDPDATLLEFLQSTYAAAANRAEWDRNALERPLRAADAKR